MKKVLFYISESEFGKESDTSTLLINEMGKYPSEFKIDYSLQAISEISKEYDIIFPRFEIPVEKKFLMELEKISEQYPDKLFINCPRSKRIHWEKNYLQEFVNTDFLPKTVVTNNYQRIKDFVYNLNKPTVIKPIDANGGKGILKLEPLINYKELENIVNRYTNNGVKDVVVQQYIENVETLGDKRITVFLYEPIKEGVKVRLPAEGSFLCNYSSGGSIHPSEYTERDQEIIDGITSFLKREKITWAGVDIIGPYLGEINVSSPGALEHGQPGPAIENIVDRLLNYKI